MGKESEKNSSRYNFRTDRRQNQIESTAFLCRRITTKVSIEIAENEGCEWEARQSTAVCFGRRQHCMKLKKIISNFMYVIMILAHINVLLSNILQIK